MTPLGAGSGRLPPPADELMNRLARVTSGFFRPWMESIRDQPGNPSGLEIHHFTTAMAVVSGRDEPWLNHVTNLTSADAGRIPEMLKVYRRRKRTPMFSVPATTDLAAVAGPLAEAGAFPTRTMAVTYGVATVPLPGPAEVDVEEIKPDEIELFADVWARGYELDETHQALARTDIAAWPSFDGVRLYLAVAGGEPAGAAALFVHDGVGYLANASALPSMRGRGVHGALLLRRIGDAAETGCEMVCGIAVYGSQSHRNMERAGLRMAGSIMQWRMPDGWPGKR